LGTGNRRGDYERSANLIRLTQNKVFPTRVRPQWFAGGKRFWYRNELIDGRTEFVLVDAEAGKRELAFDHAKLAAALAKTTGEKLRADRLRMRELSLSDDVATVSFRAAGKSWRLDRKTNEQHTKEDEKPDELSPVAAQRPFRRRQQQATSPDGKWSVIVKDHNVFLRELATKKETQLSKEGKEGDGYNGEVHWSPDSKMVVAMRHRPGFDRKISFVESRSKEHTKCTESSSSPCSWH
jgi:hypothetical protein